MPLGEADAPQWKLERPTCVDARLRRAADQRSKGWEEDVWDTAWLKMAASSVSPLRVIANPYRDAGVPITSMRAVNCGGCSEYLHPQSVSMFGKVCRARYFQPFEEESISALVQSQTLEDMGGLGFRVEGVFKFSSANFSFDWTIASLLEIPSYETSQSPTSVDRNADGNALGN